MLSHSVLMASEARKLQGVSARSGNYHVKRLQGARFYIDKMGEVTRVGTTETHHPNSDEYFDLTSI